MTNSVALKQHKFGFYSYTGEGNGNTLQYSSLPGELHGQRSLAGHSPWGRKSRTLLSDYTTKEINKWVIFAGSISVN